MKLSLLWAAASLAYAAAECFQEGSPFHPNDWMYCQDIGHVHGNLFMYYTPLNDTIMLGLHAVEGVRGWSALGPAGNGGMKGASQIVVRKKEKEGLSGEGEDNGEADEWIAEDRHSFEYTTPSMDTNQNVQLLFAQQDDLTGETAWGVLLPQNSCDEPYDYAIEDRNTFMIWAFGVESHEFSFHGTNRGQFTANLMGPPAVVPDMGAYQQADLVMPNVHVVRGEEDLDPTNAFICTYFDMDEVGKEIGFTAEDKVHMVGYEPVITEGNEDFLHHFVVFTCEGTADAQGGFTGMLDDTDLYHHKVIPACTNMPPGCSSLIAGWAVGGPPVVFPENVGMPIGGGQRWIVMQTHYYNPSLVQDVYDSSGIRVYLTTDVRPIDAGIMKFVVGVASGQHHPLPGGMKDVAMETLYVEPECTKQWSGPLTVMDVNHHSHFLGLNQAITVERDGKNLGPMRKEYRFDYNHQGGVPPVTALQTILPGDRIAASCHFDTSSVSSDSQVLIGEESNKEMCFPTIMYYPKQDIETYAYYDRETIVSMYMNNTEWCSSPPTTDMYGSMCVEKFYTDFTGFFQSLFDRFGYSLPSFDYNAVCNGGDITSELRSRLPEALWLSKQPLCPEDGCVETQSCSEEALLEQATNICEEHCGILGLTLYPDVSRTEAYDAVSVTCPQPLLDAPTLAEPGQCQVKGVLPQAIDLTNVDMVEPALDEAVSANGGSGGSSEDAPDEVVSEDQAVEPALDEVVSENGDSDGTKSEVVPGEVLTATDEVVSDDGGSGGTTSETVPDKVVSEDEASGGTTHSLTSIIALLVFSVMLTAPCVL